MKTYNVFILAFSIIIICLCAYLIYFTVSNSVITEKAGQQGSEKTVVIDAGHGGADGGALGYDLTEEKELNLEIAQYLEQYLDAFGVCNIMTRTDDNSIHSENADTIREQKVSDIHNRMKIMDNTDNCLFVSIHQNSFSNSALWGTQVFYSPNTTASPELADCIQHEVSSLIQPDNKRVIKKCGNSVYLLYYAKKPAVLVECGFMTNNDELEKLKNENYQKQMAYSIACGIIDYINKGC